MSRLLPGGIPVFMYHWIDPGAAPAGAARFGVHPESFARQMEWLARGGRRALDLEDLGRALAGEAPFPADDAFVLTFDDGYADLEPQVVPVLARHGFVATVFVVTGAVGGASGWDDSRRPLLGWEAIRRLDGGCVRFASHTASHPDLTRLDGDSARRQLVDSKRRLEDELGREVAAFAYPHGRFDRRLEEEVGAAGYRVAATDLRGLNRPGDRPLRVRRVMVRAGDRLPGFALKAATGHDARTGARALAGLETGGPATR